MNSERERAAVVALLRARRGGRPAEGAGPRHDREPHPSPAQLIEREGSAERALAATLRDDPAQASLLPQDPEPAIQVAIGDLRRWAAGGVDTITVVDEDRYPRNLRAVHDRPALIFVRGRRDPTDEQAVSVVGSRAASGDGLRRASRLAADLATAGVTVVSGLAAGIDAAAHRAALQAGGRTIAVIGTGVNRAYPPKHADLQRRIAERCAVISPFWPDARPTRQSFPIRNGLMSGLTLATVIVEATHQSGTRTQARQALKHGRPVFIHTALLEQAWASELAERPNVHAFETSGEVIETLERARVGPGERAVPPTS